MNFFRKFCNTEYVVLFGIVVLAAFLRFYKLESIPSGFYVDEAAIGYNSYSILKTGADEYGKLFPVFLRSYGAYSSPLYTYLTAFPTLLFGPRIFSVRLLSAISGILNVFFFYLILKESGLIKRITFILLGTFLFAIVPWNVFFSRGAFEANLSLMLYMFSIYLFLLSRKKFNLLYIATAILSLSTYAYQAQRLVAHIFLIGVLFIFFRSKHRMREIIFPVLLFFIIQIPQLLILTTPAFTLRASGLFYKSAVASQSEKILFLPQPISYFLAFAREFLAQFVSYLSPKNLFFLPDSDPQRSIPELSVFYSWMIVPFLVGIFSTLAKPEKKVAIILILLVFTSIIPVSFTGDPFSSLRSLTLVLPFGLVIARGMEILAGKGKRIFWILTLLIILSSFVIFWRNYFVLFPKERAKAWDYGYLQLSQIIKANSESKFVIDQSRMNPSYVLLAFFLEYPPDKFQEVINPEIKTHYYNDIRFDPYYNFANIETRQIFWEEDVYKDQILVGDGLAVSDTQMREHSLEKVFEIKGPLEEIVFVGYKTRPDLKCINTNYINTRCMKSK
jgi:hypothetical protein